MGNTFNGYLRLGTLIALCFGIIAWLVWEIMSMKNKKTSIEPHTLSVDKLEALPVGTIVYFNGDHAQLPRNWHLCDGRNGTPDLRDKFILGGNHSDSSVKHSGGNELSKNDGKMFGRRLQV